MHDTTIQKWLPRGGEMGRLVREHDWSKSSLGRADAWPQSLKTALSICMDSKFPMVIWWSPEFNVFYNDAYIPILGPTKHPMYLGKPAKLQWPEIWDVVGTLANDVLSTGNATWSEDKALFMVRKGFVEEAYFTFSFSPARSETGEVGGMFCAVQEMTARVIGERRLSVLRDLSAGEYKTIPDACISAAFAMSKSPNDIPFSLIYLIDSEKNNAVLCASSGLNKSSRLAEQIIELRDGSTPAWPLKRVLGMGAPERMTGLRARYSSELPKIPYEEMPDSAYVMPIQFAGQSSPAAFLIMGLNPRLEFDQGYEDFLGLISKQFQNQISGVRALEDEKRRSESLAEIDRAKSAFFSNVSHEFRTPLTLMLGPIEEMLSGQKGELPLELRAETEILHRNSLRLLKLVNDLLDFSRIEAGRMQATFSAFELGPFTLDLAASFRSTIEKAGINLVTEIDALSGTYYVDRDLWEKIVFNLLSNALKFTFKGEIRLSLKERAHEVMLTVSDTGIGIPERELPKVFDRFYRVEGGVGRTHEGTGIGLALVRELAKLHGGEVRAESKIGKGSSFTVTIPSGREHLAPDRISLPSGENRIGETSSQSFIKEANRWTVGKASAESTAVNPEVSGRQSVLIADDNADMRDYIRKLLESRYRVLTAKDGKEALDLIRSARPDLVISDIMMPVMDGIQLLQEVRSDLEIQTLPLIFLSARAGEEAKVSGVGLGADDYLTKPFSAKELLARVQTQLRLSEMRRNVTEKEAVVAHLAQRQRWLQSILNSVPTPLLLLESETGRIKFANQAANTMAGGRFPMDVPLEQYALHFNVTDIYGVIMPVAEMPAARAARGERVRDAEVVWKAQTGDFSLLVDSEKVPTLEGEPELVILCLKDITQMRLVQNELKRLIDARDEFLSIASHELNTPLTSLKLNVQMVKKSIANNIADAYSPQKMNRLIDQTDRQITRISRLVSDMLDVSRMESGQFELNREETDLSVLISDVVDRLSEQLKESGSELKIDAPRMRGKWDRFRLEQILINLLTNAFRYGEGKLIEVKASLAGNTVTLLVRDHGKGIPTADLGRIFERFERAISSSEVSGLGLGLYIVRQIVNAHGGTIEVESQLGEGACFIVKLPLVSVDSE